MGSSFVRMVEGRRKMSERTKQRRRTDEQNWPAAPKGPNPNQTHRSGGTGEGRRRHRAVEEAACAGEDLTETREPSTNDESGGRSSPRSRNRSNAHGLSDLEVLISLVILGLVCVGGYFLLMKLVEISRQEDCLLGGGSQVRQARLSLPPNGCAQPSIRFAQVGTQQALETPDVMTMRGDSDSVQVDHFAPRFV
jgi:hypothetical protein